MADTPTTDDKRHALEKILERLRALAPQAAGYALALGSVYIAGYGDIPKDLLPAVVAGGSVGINLISNLIDRVIAGSPPSDAELMAEFEPLVRREDLAPLLTTQEYYNGLRQLGGVVTSVKNDIVAAVLAALEYRLPKPPAPPRTSVFFSYARADDGTDYDDPAKSLLRRLHDDLRDEFAVWWDRVSLPSRGLAFGPEIEAAITACERFVLFAGPGAAASDYVQAELRCALRLCKPVTVVLRAGSYDDIPAQVERVNAIDFRPPRAHTVALADLCDRLRGPAPLGKPINVKPVPSYYVERRKPFADAQAALAADAIAPDVTSTPRAAAVYGYGGVGKSTLASALAHDCTLRGLYPGGIVWVEIGQKPDMQTRLADLGVHLGDSRDQYTGPGTDLKTAQGRLSWWLHEHGVRALFILDDVWDADVVKQVPVQDTACRLLVTTRSGALARKIDGVDIRLDVMTADEGAALLAGRLGGADDDPTYKRIAEALNGHTLSIALAAAQVAEGYADDAADMLRLLEKGDNPLAHLAVDDEDKDENVALSLGLSYQALPEDVQRRFRALGIFARESSVDRAALAAVWGDADADAEGARTGLRTLLGVGLLDALTPDPAASESGTSEALPPSAPTRYTQHRLLHAYARALLEREGEAEAAFWRYTDWAIAEARALDKLPMEDWAAWQPFEPHMLAVGDSLALHWAAGSPAQDLAARCEAFARGTVAYLRTFPNLLYVTSEKTLELPSRVNWYEVGIQAARVMEDSASESWHLYSCALLLAQLGRAERALELLEQALAIDSSRNDPREIAVTQGKIADLYVKQGRWDEALALYEASLAAIQKLNDPRAIAVTQINLAQHFFNRSEALSRALSLLWNGFKIIQRLGNPREIDTVETILRNVRQSLEQTFDALWTSAIQEPLPNWLSSSTPSPAPDPQAEFARQIMALYQQGGAAAVRAALAQMGATEEQIAGLLAGLEAAGPHPPTPSP